MENVSLLGTIFANIVIIFSSYLFPIMIAYFSIGILCAVMYLGSVILTKYDTESLLAFLGISLLYSLALGAVPAFFSWLFYLLLKSSLAKLTSYNIEVILTCYMYVGIMSIVMSIFVMLINFFNRKNENYNKKKDIFLPVAIICGLGYPSVYYLSKLMAFVEHLFKYFF